MEKKITLTEALCGSAVHIQHLDGRVLRIANPPGMRAIALAPVPSTKGTKATAAAHPPGSGVNPMPDLCKLPAREMAAWPRCTLFKPAFCRPAGGTLCVEI
eukprot:1148822-Pelagomonas_calceolata.AAC.4